MRGKGTSTLDINYILIILGSHVIEAIGTVLLLAQ